jgi:hypothetical protein
MALLNTNLSGCCTGMALLHIHMWALAQPCR